MRDPPPPLIEFLDPTRRFQVLRVAYRMHYSKKCYGVKQNAKKCAIGETEGNEILSLYLRKTENLSEEKEGMGEREKRED